MRMVPRLLFLAVIFSATLAFGPAPSPSLLFAVAGTGDIVKLQRLAAHGADLQVRDDQGRTLLFVAAASADRVLLRFLLRRHLDVDARSTRGETALHVAAITGNLRVIKLLLAAGASSRAYTKKCMSPLDYAAGFGQPRLFALLKPLTASAPLPADGTVAECGLTRDVASYEKTREMFHRQNLTVLEDEDYTPAVETLHYLAAVPEFGARMIPALLTALDQPSLPLTEADGAADKLFRELIIKTLAKVARSKAEKDQVAKGLLTVIDRGPCSVYRAMTCEETSCTRNFAGMVKAANKVIFHRQEPWPRSSEDETCYNCSQCENTRIGNAYTVTLPWFAVNSAYRAAAEGALRRQVQAKVLPQSEADHLRKSLDSAARDH